MKQINEYEQAKWLKYAGIEAAGVCWELCRRYIKKRLKGSWSPSSSVGTIESFKDTEKMPAIYSVHTQRRNPNLDVNREIHGLTRAWGYGSAVKSHSRLSFKGLRSSGDIIDHVLTIPGAYIYIFHGGGKKGAGHAIAFDSHKGMGEFVMFDPNFGEFQAEPGDDAAKIKYWWKSFWKEKYKNYEEDSHKLFKGGTRELTRYELSNEERWNQEKGHYESTGGQKR